MAQKISVATVILNHNDNVNTLRLVSEFAASGQVDLIAVVDNSGKNALSGSEEELKSTKVEFMTTGNCGYARGNNAAVQMFENRYGLPEYIIISNPDVEIDNASILKCLEFLKSNPGYAIAAPHMLKPDGEPHHLAGWKERTFLCDLAYSSGILSRLIGMYRETYPPEHWQTMYSDVDCVTGSFFMIRSDAFKQAGYFDTNTFLFYEEDILAYKLKRLGYKEAVLNTCSFIHREGVSAGRRVSYLKKYRIMQNSRLYFHRRYKRVNIFEYSALLAATCLGYCENLIKTIIFRNGKL